MGMCVVCVWYVGGLRGYDGQNVIAVVDAVVIVVIVVTAAGFVVAVVFL